MMLGEMDSTGAFSKGKLYIFVCLFVCVLFVCLYYVLDELCT